MQDPSLPFSAEAQFQQLMAQFQQQAMVEPHDKKISRRKFTPDEDDLLRNLVTQIGKSDWATIAQHFPNRTSRQCRDRWKHYVSPEVVTGHWSEADESLLLSKVNEFGPKWSTIAQFFPGRTDIGIKNRYISITGQKAKDYGFRGQDSGLVGHPDEGMLFSTPYGNNLQLPSNNDDAMGGSYNQQ
jgi:hypothetical protein